MKTNSQCKFDIAWIGQCKEEAIKDGMCEKHSKLVCCSCGKPATHGCGETGGFVCGAPLCDDCEHTIFPSGTNGGVLFYNEKHSDGMKSHCKKSDQKFFPWYVISLGEDDTDIAEVLRKFNNAELSYVDANNQINEICRKKNEIETK